MIPKIFLMLAGAGTGGILGLYMLKEEYSYSSKQVTAKLENLSNLLKEKQVDSANN